MIKLSSALQKDIQLLSAHRRDRGDIGRDIAAYCRADRDSLIASGRASRHFDRLVDWSLSKPEEAVDLQNGRIIYSFRQLADAVRWGLEELKRCSPLHSGAYRKSWTLYIDGTPYVGNIDDISDGSEVWIVNTMPYARKIEVGGQRVSIPPRVTDRVARAVKRRFGGVTVWSAFKDISDGTDARGGYLPYILRGRGVASGITWSRKTGWTRLHRPYRTRRKDRQAGQPMRYPALVLGRRF
ncbi:DUF2272 domain-containing protein [Acetobacteraceae bacterium EV16G]|uniref:DUF2272 domain-containing protein n=1 Tax=Sorlinia euscelidii TaxID=3081148 RepID=A0ABU7U1X5_9PROT